MNDMNTMSLQKRSILPGRSPCGTIGSREEKGGGLTCPPRKSHRNRNAGPFFRHCRHKRNKSSVDTSFMAFNIGTILI